MTGNLRTTIILIALAVLGWYFWPSDGKEHPAGILAPDVPVQEDLKAQPVIDHGEYTITGLAKFSLKARVLSAEPYWIDRGSGLVPVDLALGWGKMSDSAVIDQLDITQSVRFYRWNTKGSDYPIPKEEIISSSANMHLIPATKAIERRIKEAEKGDIVEFSGYLARADRKDGFNWSSSMTRTDTGDGACEVVYVEHFRILP
ncbi:MAG TPA: hypothetical protein PKH10_04315 [bacterium]|nr:hypothetical protein [bacterium]